MPNLLLVPEKDKTLTVNLLSEDQVKVLLAQNDWKSFVGHQTTAALFTERLGFDITANRVNVTLDAPDSLVVGLFTPPHHLEEGQKWTEAEILAMPINWVLIQKIPTECIQIVDAANNYQPQSLM